MKRKPKISIEECCKEFYDKTISHAIIADIDRWSMLLGTCLKFVTEADTSFSAIDPDLFRQEMTAVRMEVFALAFARKVKWWEDLMLAQSVLTRRYLEGNGKLGIWDIMGEYNEVIALSAGTAADGQPMSNWHITKINKLRYDTTLKWGKTLPSNPTDEGNKQALCMGRVIMRMGADMKREDCIAPKILAMKLADRLGYHTDDLKSDSSPKAKALVGLWNIILGFYNEAEDYLKSIRL
jgi:hypothetical protein